MHPSSFLLAVVVLAVPTRAITELSAQVGPSPALYALGVMQAPGAELGRFFDQAAAKGLDPRLVKSVIAAESEFTPRAKSPAGAFGLMQVMPGTAGEMGVPGGALFDPAANIRAGTRYLAYLFARAWERYHLKGVPFTKAPEWLVQRVIAGYNAGPRWVSRRPLYQQTREYVKKVLLYYRSAVTELKAAGS